MSSLEIARLETGRLLRAPGTWLGAIGFTAVLVSGVAIPSLLVPAAGASMAAAFLLGPAMELVFPLLVILLTYGAVAGHRSRGTIHVFSSAPVDRRDTLHGLVLARMVAIGAIALTGLGLGIATVLLLYGVPPIRPVLGFLLLSLVTAVAFTAIGVGVSAATRRPVRALAGLVGGFAVAHTVWEPFVHSMYNIAAGSENELPRVVEWVVLVSPLQSYGSAAHGVLPPAPHLDVAVADGSTHAETGAMVGGEIAAAELGIAISIIVAWGVLSLLVGTWSFRRAEIE